MQNSLDILKSNILNLLNNKNRDELIDSKWLSEVISPTIETVEFTKYFSKFLKFKKSSLKPSTIKKLGSIKNRIIKYEEVHVSTYIRNIDNKFSKLFQFWCDEEGYDHNTKLKTLKVIKTVCNHASENGLTISSQLKGLRYKKTEHIHLNFDELKQIIDTDVNNERLSIAKGLVNN